VDHDRPIHGFLGFASFTHSVGNAFFRPAVLELEALRKLEVELDSGALERPLEGVFDADVNLGSVERAVAGIELPFARDKSVQSLAQLLNVRHHRCVNVICVVRFR
jgi:hypothetical protein